MSSDDESGSDSSYEKPARPCTHADIDAVMGSLSDEEEFNNSPAGRLLEVEWIPQRPITNEGHTSLPDDFRGTVHHYSVSEFKAAMERHEVKEEVVIEQVEYQLRSAITDTTNLYLMLYSTRGSQKIFARETLKASVMRGKLI